MSKIRVIALAVAMLFLGFFAQQMTGTHAQTKRQYLAVFVGDNTSGNALAMSAEVNRHAADGWRYVGSHGMNMIWEK